MMDVGGIWSTQQLAEFVCAMSEIDAVDALLREAVEQAAEAVEAEVGALVASGAVAVCYGFAPSRIRAPELLAVAGGTHPTLEVPGVGRCLVLTAPCEQLAGGQLLVARSGPDGFSQEERSLVRAMARVLGLRLDALQTLAGMRERQTLLERLSRIQRSISSRQPLDDVLHSIVSGAAELLGDEVVALRLVDPADSTVMETAAAIGMGDRLPAALPTAPEDGIRSSMATPVRQGDVTIGSLTVATRRPGRSYTASEQEVLEAFAEHASLAITDARTVDALHAAVQTATHQALHDTLTGLPNRALFIDRVRQVSAEARRRHEPLAVLFLDLDNFKLVNDSLGHSSGDALLQVVAGRCVACVRESDTVARLGGDEFALLLEGASQREAERVARRILAALAEPLPLVSRVISTASIGVVCVTAPTESAEDLIRDADVAMYRAKADGKGTYVLFEPRMRDDVQARTQLEHDLHGALDSGQLVVHYQPVVELATSTTVGVEALIRWQHPQRGLVGPTDFVPVAEDTGLIGPIGAWVLREACRQAVRWRVDTGLRLAVGVNVSPRQLGHPGFARLVRQTLAETGFPAAALTLEITENVLVQNMSAAATELAELKGLGVQLAVDDFGTGYSSLGYLASLPLDTVKVDRLFVAQLDAGGTTRPLAPAILGLAESLGLLVIAEGIETDEQLRRLVELGCRYGQGFRYSPALPPAELVEFAGRCRPALVPAPRRAGLERENRHQEPGGRPALLEGDVHRARHVQVVE
ncbi:MAG: putative bifunctional diguanylate cyclase/phosphodiesterase [Mycobacteriales bacterium]